MNTPKAAPMAREEVMLFVKLVAANKVINNKATNAISNRLKDDAWQAIANDFNSSVKSPPRTPSQLRLKWENLKKTTRKHCANLRSIRDKNDAKYFIPRNEDIFEKVASLLTNSCETLSDQCSRDGITEPKSESVNDEDEEDSILNADSGGGEQNDVLSEIEISPPQEKIEEIFFCSSPRNETPSLEQHKSKMQEEKCKARISRDNAMTEYLMAKRRKIDLENEEKELNIQKLKLELEKTKLEILKLKSDLKLV